MDNGYGIIKTVVWEGMNGSDDIFGYSISLSEVVITRKILTSLSTRGD